MIESMTGFVNVSENTPEFNINIQIKSINSKGINVSTKLPARYFAKEPEIIKVLQDKLKRGKISLYAKIDILKPEAISENINITELKIYNDTLNKIRQELKIDDNITLELLIKFAKLSKDNLFEISEQEWQTFYKVLLSAIDELIASRRYEGQIIYNDFQNKLQILEEKLRQIEELLQERTEHFKQKLLNALSQLPKNIEYSKERYEEELLYYLDKYDINEEVVRFKAHISNFRKTMDTPPPNGNKLNFYIQELWREINTLGNKANFLPIQNLAVEVKEILSQMKEQISNVA